MSISALGYIGINVTDVDAWVELSTNVLGLQATKTERGTVRLRNDEREYRVELIPGDSDGVAYLGLEVATEADLAETIEVLEGAGHTAKLDPETARLRDVTGLALVDDPAGTRVEVYYGQKHGDAAFVSPTGARFVTAGRTGLGFGHAFFIVPDLQEALNFYVDLLGFRVSDTIPAGPADAYFLRCNPRHHSLALAAFPGAPTKLLHIMFEVDEIDTVGYAYDKCKQGAAGIVYTLGRHSNDRMLSFYLRNPSGFDIEFGTQGLQIDDDGPHGAQNRFNVESFWGHTKTALSGRGPEAGAEY
jgi:2,3-dihydroxybiphenyl 1,2-dioxygenase